MILDEMPENVDVDLLKNLYSLTTMSPLQSNQTMQTPQGLAGLPVVRRFEGSEGSEEGLADQSPDTSTGTSTGTGTGTGTGTSSSAGQSGQGTSGSGLGGPDEGGDETQIGGADVATVDIEGIKTEVADPTPDPAGFAKAVSQMEADAPFGGDIDLSIQGLAEPKNKTGFESQEEAAKTLAELENRVENEPGFGYDDLVAAGYFDIKERSFDAQMGLDAVNLENQLKAQGFKDVSVTPNKDGTFSFDAPNFGEALGAGLSEMGKGFTGAVGTGMDLIEGIMSVTPTGLAEGAMRGTGPGGALTDMFGVSKPAQAIGRGLEGFLGISRGIGKGVRGLATGNLQDVYESVRDVTGKLKNQQAAPDPSSAPAPTTTPDLTGISSLTQPSLTIQDLIDRELSRRDQATGFGRTAFMDT